MQNLRRCQRGMIAVWRQQQKGAWDTEGENDTSKERMLDMAELSRLGMVEAVELTCRHDSLLIH